MSFDSSSAQYTANDMRQERQPSQARLTTEEIRILKECNRESFFYRCVPLGIIATSATYLGVKKGFLKSHPKYGATFKLLGAGMFAWIIGKMSYRNKCEDKFIHLANSSIGDVIRKKRGYVLSEFPRDAYSKSDDDDLHLYTGDSMSSLPDKHYDARFGALNLDTDKNVPIAGLDDRERPTTNTFGSLTTEDNQLPKTTTSYDELRQRNRDSYNSQFQKPPSSSTTSHSPPKIYDSFAPQRRAFQEEGASRRNTYGD